MGYRGVKSNLENPVDCLWITVKSYGWAGLACGVIGKNILTTKM
jgi:hypothetical protein